MKDKDKCLWHTRLAPVAFPFFPQQKISGDAFVMHSEMILRLKAMC
jgi:hypothetical protein